MSSAIFADPPKPTPMARQRWMPCKCGDRICYWPRLGGFGFLREIRSAPDRRDIAVIVLSVRPGEDGHI